jgi:hypothetical protein
MDMIAANILQFFKFINDHEYRRAANTLLSKYLEQLNMGTYIENILSFLTTSFWYEWYFSQKKLPPLHSLVRNVFNYEAIENVKCFQGNWKCFRILSQVWCKKLGIFQKLFIETSFRELFYKNMQESE